MTDASWRWFHGMVIAVCLVGAAPLDAGPRVANEQAAPAGAASHVTIPFLANATKPMDIDFEGGECDVDRTGRTMTCQFQQVFLTTSPLTADTCIVTTNGYDRIFQKEADSRWVSREGPTGACGVVDVATLQDEGGVRWTMEMRKVITKPGPACLAVNEPPEVLSWQNLRRSLPCKFLQPGSMSR